MAETQFVETLDAPLRTQPASDRCVSILSIGTASPAYSSGQDKISEWMAGAFVDQPAVVRAIRSLHNLSGIDTRYSCCPEYLHPVHSSSFGPGQGSQPSPTTAERMSIYAQEAPLLGTTAALQALKRYTGEDEASIRAVTATVTHLVVVSCTGFFAPGLDFVIAKKLGLAATVKRTMIGFMGCSAAFNGLQTASQIVHSQPDARVLVVSVELCSLHIQQSVSPDHLIAMSLFSDGASACLVGEAKSGDTEIYRLDGFRSEIKPDTESEMVWEIGDNGFVLHLSPQIPEHLAMAAPESLLNLFDGERPEFWAIHPGGRAIVDRLEKVFALAPEQIAASRSVLRHYGNLSSATILFVLDELLRNLPREEQSSICGHEGKSCSGVAMAFGPGLVIEMARLTYMPVVPNQN